MNETYEAIRTLKNEIGRNHNFIINVADISIKCIIYVYRWQMPENTTLLLSVSFHGSTKLVLAHPHLLTDSFSFARCPVYHMEFCFQFGWQNICKRCNHILLQNVCTMNSSFIFFSSFPFISLILCNAFYSDFFHQWQ